jgi:single-strand DNA-binding protein
MSNNLSFLGRIGNDPELKQVGQTELLEVNVANNVGFGDRRSTNWFRCTIWGKRAQSLKQYLTKGKQIFVTGQLTLREYTTKEGEKRISPEVSVDQLDFVSGGDNQGDGNAYGGAPATNQNAAPAAPAPASAETDDDMPF